MIVLRDVTKRFGRLTVLDSVSLQINPGEFLCVTGPSGAGKSTLLSLLVGAQVATTGIVEVDGVDLRKVPAGALQVFRRRVGIVFQDYKLLMNRTVEENIAFPLEVCGASEKQINIRVVALLKRMNLKSRAKALPSELSGGEKARVAIARAIAHEPLIILADEPTGNLDPEQAKAVMDLFRELHQEGATIVLATHDLHLAGSDVRVVRLEQGKITGDSGVARQSHIPRKEALMMEEPELIEEKEVEVTEEEETVEARMGRRVRVTAIHSD